MSTARVFVERMLFPASSSSQRRRHFRFYLVAVFLGIISSAIFGVILYALNTQGRL